MEEIVQFENVGLRYGTGAETLADLSFTLFPGSFYFLTGASGAGKTSLLKLLYLSQRPSRGVIRLFGEDAVTMPRERLPGFRRRIGVVFQDFRLVPHLSAFDNIALPLRVAGVKEKDLKNQFSKKRATKAASKERKEELDKSKIAVVLEMINRGIKAGFKAEYTLTDSWFFCEKLLRLVVKKGMDLISGVKMGKLNFIYKGKEYSPKALLSISKRKAKYNRKLKVSNQELERFAYIASHDLKSPLRNISNFINLFLVGNAF